MTPTAKRWARLAFLVLLVLLGHRAFGHEYGYVPILGDINLAIHETGHYVFMPFGELMTYAGGSLFQVLVPLVFAGYFAFGKREHRDGFAVAACLWWAATNLLSVSIYAADARAGQLMLISGATGEDDPAGHDFYMIFAHLGTLNRDTIYAGRIRSLAGATMISSVFVGLWYVVRPMPAPSPDAEAETA